MTEKKKWGSTVMGWFVVQDSADPGGLPAETGEDPAEEAAIQNAAGAPPPPVFRSAPPPATGGKVDFDQVFEAAGIEGEARERVSRTLELLTSLPPGTDDKTKQQIVMASLRAFAVPIENIIETGAEEIQALEAYIRTGAKDTDETTSEAEKRIKQFEEEIVNLRKAMQQSVEEQQAVMKACNERKLDVQKVLEFFGQEAVARVVRESPKLHEPKTGK